MTKKHIIMTNDQNTEEILIDDEDVSDVPALPTATEGEEIDWAKEAEKYKGMAERRGTKLRKFKEKKPAAPAAPADQGTKKGELGYDQKAYLASVHDVKHPDDVAFIANAMKETGKTLEEVMASTFVQGQLKEQQAHRATKEATPAADDRSGGAARDSVEYWLNKGELPPADQVELRRKVVNAKIAKSRGDDPFKQ